VDTNGLNEHAWDAGHRRGFSIIVAKITFEKVKVKKYFKISIAISPHPAK